MTKENSTEGAGEQKPSADFVRGHLVRIETKEGEAWVNAFLVTKVEPAAKGGARISSLGEDRPLLVVAGPSAVAGRLMQAKIYTSDPGTAVAAAIGGLGAWALGRASKSTGDEDKKDKGGAGGTGTPT